MPPRPRQLEGKGWEWQEGWAPPARFPAGRGSSRRAGRLAYFEFVRDQAVRKKTLDLLFAYDAQVELVYLEQPPNVIFKRNTQRDTSLPNKSIERMLFKWEVPLPTEAHVVDDPLA